MLKIKENVKEIWRRITANNNIYLSLQAQSIIKSFLHFRGKIKFFFYTQPLKEGYTKFVIPTATC